MAELAAEDIALSYGPRQVIERLSLAVPDGQVTAIVGPNGCGKSTLLRGFARLLRPDHGHILLDGSDIGSLPTKQVARRVGLLPQSPLIPEGITVAELVGRGRAPHHGLFRQWTRTDDEIVAEALELTDTVALAGRHVEALSGGQRQRVWIAMVLAQRTGILLLDEPTSFLDIAHQVEVLELIDELNAQRGTTVVMVLHDLTMAARYAHQLVAMRDGAVLAAGSPAQIVTPAVVEEVFGIACSVLLDEATGTPVVVPHGRTRTSAPVGRTNEGATR
jgi:iron complex transport system ATP-binding protein